LYIFIMSSFFFSLRSSLVAYTTLIKIKKKKRR
jgi:hypothetical protein